MRRKYCYLLFIFLFFFFTFRVFAFENGYDISFPQCGGDFPSLSHGFAILGVNHGKAFSFNQCLLDEYIWAKKAKARISVYLNLNYPSGDTVSFGEFACKKNDAYCHAYNYGYQSAKSSVHYAKSQFIIPDMWWFDIETENTWSDNL